jgi:hypothetical protein
MPHTDRRPLRQIAAQKNHELRAFWRKPSWSTFSGYLYRLVSATLKAGFMPAVNGIDVTRTAPTLSIVARILIYSHQGLF